jgi:[acyl-carrier-protein] S-malonyltransferase
MSLTAFLFPGQGSQYVGMGREFYDQFPMARTIFQRAEEATGLPLKELCFNGPLEQLTSTVHLQPAITAVNLAIWSCLKEKGLTAEVVAGHSLGEYTALYAAGVLGLEDTMGLVKIRGALMDQAARNNPGAMAAIMGLSPDSLGSILTDLSRDGSIGAANYNTPEQTVISGTKDLVDKAVQLVGRAGGKAVPLAVSGAWHSPLMKEAMESFKEALSAVPFNPPQCPMLFNVTGAAESDPQRIKKIMEGQIGQPVRWTDVVGNLKIQGVSRFVEVGPKKVLLGLVRKCLPKDYPFQSFNVEDLKSLEVFLGAEKTGEQINN